MYNTTGKSVKLYRNQIVGRAKSNENRDIKDDRPIQAECFMLSASEEENTTVDEVGEQLKNFDLDHIDDHEVA